MKKKRTVVKSEKSRSVIVDGIAVSVTRKPIMNIHLRVRSDGFGGVRVSLSVPACISDSQVVTFLEKKTDWIKDNVKRYTLAGSFIKRDDIRDGGVVVIFGKSLPLSLVCDPKTKRYAVSAEGERLFVVAPEKVDDGKLFSAVVKYERNALLEAVLRFKGVWESRTGLFARSFAIRKMTARWGSCNTVTGDILISSRLVKMPEECVEYVVLHEILHLRYRNHDGAFYGALSGFMPDWQIRREFLNGMRSE